MAAIALLFPFWGFGAVFAQQPNTVQHVYDDGNKLIESILPNGQHIYYEYDQAGNLIRIRRTASTTVKIISFTPDEGAVGTKVTLLGDGFSATSNQNTVTFNGVQATVLEATPTRLQVSVPTGATSGPISVTTPNGSALTQDSFRVVTGVVITPSFFRMLPGEQFKFRASVEPADVIQDVVWSVNGVRGGSPTYGLITTDGIYSAPTSIPAEAIRIRATSAPHATVFGEAEVALDTELAYHVDSLSVQFGPTPEEIAAQQLSVNFGPDPFEEKSPPVTAFFGQSPFTEFAPPVTAFFAPQPTITGFSPMYGPVGTAVVLTGTNLTGVTNVTVNGVQATGSYNSTGTQLTFLVPTGATSGPIVVSKQARNGVTAVTATNPIPFCVSTSPGNVVLTPTTQTFPASGGDGSFTVTTGTTCGWTASTTSSWIILGTTLGSGQGTVTFTVAPNKEQGTSGPVTRVGTITVEGQSFTVIQNPADSVNSQVSLSTTGVTSGAAPQNSAGYGNLVTLSVNLTNTGGNTFYQPIYFRLTQLSKNGADQDPTRPYRLSSADGFVLDPISGGLPGSIQTVTPNTSMGPGATRSVQFLILRGVTQSLTFLVEVYASQTAPLTNNRLGPQRNTSSAPIARFEIVIDAAGNAVVNPVTTQKQSTSKPTDR